MEDKNINAEILKVLLDISKELKHANQIQIKIEKRKINESWRRELGWK